MGVHSAFVIRARHVDLAKMAYNLSGPQTSAHIIFGV